MSSLPPLRSRRIPSSASASASLRKSCASSLVSSPMAKYASCSRAHGPQNATPRILHLRTTRARASRLVAYLARCRLCPLGQERPLLMLLDRLLEGVARAEGGNLLGRDLHILAGLRISPFPGPTLLNGELAEARDLDLLAGLQRLGHD